MKRIITLATALAVVAIPASASAGGTSDAAGRALARGGQDLSITFVIKTLGGKPVEIDKFKFSNLTATCDGSQMVDVDGKIGSMKVNDKGKFDGKVAKGGGKVLVEGDSNSKGTRVEGTIRAKGTLGGLNGCDSGKVKWKAS